MSFARSLQLFDLAMWLLNVAGVCVAAHVLLSVTLRWRVRASEQLFAEVFGSPVWGDIARLPWLMRARFFWPWASSPGEVASRDIYTRVLFWAARLSGAGAIAGFAGFLATVVYVGVRRAGVS